VSTLTIFGSPSNASSEPARGGQSQQADLYPANSSPTPFYGPGLRQAIWVVVERGIDDIGVVDRATGIFGVGESFDDASADLLDALREHHDLLQQEARDASISPELHFQLRYLSLILA
jgi:hypothetical protein